MDYLIDVETEDGTLSIEIMDSAGKDIFAETFSESAPSSVQSVTLTGTARIKILADEHRGSFSISPES